MVKYILISGLAIMVARKYKSPKNSLIGKKKEFWCISNFYSCRICPKFHLINSSEIQSVRVLTYQNHVKKAKYGINISKLHVIFPNLIFIASFLKRVILHKHRDTNSNTKLEQFKRKFRIFQAKEFLSVCFKILISA